MTSLRHAPAATAPAGPDQGRQGPVMTAARPRVGVGAAPLIAQLLALALIGLGVIAIRDVLVVTGVLTGQPWIPAAISAVDGLTSQPWLVAVAAAAIVLGVIVLIAAVKPRPRKVVPLTSASGVYLRTGDVAAVAQHAAADVDGITHARVSATAQAVTVTADTTAPSDQHSAVRGAVTQAVNDALTGLERPPSVKVTLSAIGMS